MVFVRHQVGAFNLEKSFSNLASVSDIGWSSRWHPYDMACHPKSY